MNIVRDESYYEQKIIDELLGSLDAVILKQYCISQSRADLIVITKDNIEVIEIKSDLDTFYRLDKQILNYKKLTSNVTVITDNKKSKLLLDKNIKVIELDSDGKFKIIKENLNEVNFEVKTLYRFLRKYERHNIINNVYGQIVYKNDSTEYEELYEQFKRISKKDIWNLSLTELMNRKGNI